MAFYRLVFRVEETVYREDEVYMKHLGGAKQSASQVAKSYPNITIDIFDAMGTLLAQKEHGHWVYLPHNEE